MRVELKIDEKMNKVRDEKMCNGYKECDKL